MQTLKIDEELKALIPPLRESEYSQLEENILSEGVREPIIVWNGTIIDGHNRYAIARKHGLDFTVKEMQFDSKDAVISWMIYNQFGRRNLSIYDSVCLALKLKPRIEADAKKRKLATQNNKAAKNLQGAEVQNFAPLGRGKTIDKIAALAGVSRETVRKVEKINELATHLRADDIIDRLRKGEISISLALEAIQMRKEESADLEELTEKIKEHQRSMAVAAKEAYENISAIIRLYESKEISEQDLARELGNDEDGKPISIYALKNTFLNIVEKYGINLETDSNF